MLELKVTRDCRADRTFCASFAAVVLDWEAAKP